MLENSTKKHLGALSKRQLWEIRKSCSFGSLTASKAALCASCAGMLSSRPTTADKVPQWPPCTFLKHACYDFILLNYIKVLNLLTSHKNINTFIIKALTSYLGKGRYQPQGVIFPYIHKTFFLSSLGIKFTKKF